LQPTLESPLHICQIELSQKQLYAKFLNKFRDVFTEEIIAGNCGDEGTCN